MSVCGQNGQAEEDSGSEEVTAATTTVRDLYKQKPVSKAVRVLTVLAYLLSVSLAAILLSVYYVCVWKSPELPPLNDTVPAASKLSARPPSPAAYTGVSHNDNNEYGGGDSAVNVAPTPISITDSLEHASSTTESPLDFSSSEPQDNTTSYSIEDFNTTTTSIT